MDDDMPAIESPLTSSEDGEDSSSVNYVAADYFQSQGIFYNVDEMGMLLVSDYGVSACTGMRNQIRGSLEKNLEQRMEAEGEDMLIEHVNTE